MTTAPSPIAVDATRRPAPVLRPYRCYVIAATGHILALETVTCGSDDAARQAAERFLQQQSGCAAVELWDVGRRLVRLSAPPHLAQAA